VAEAQLFGWAVIIVSWESFGNRVRRLLSGTISFLDADKYAQIPEDHTLTRHQREPSA
jgi:hypothetical protein